mmetsp:Transcript_108334/g.170867  ORF Transcript_108334/g.170867 Transcript_108334/m.170867 type:complete len:179 (+) Transcript_108334:57-593(+)
MAQSSQSESGSGMRHRREKLETPKFNGRAPHEIRAFRTSQRLKKDVKKGVAPSILATWQQALENPLQHYESENKERWCESHVVSRKLKHEEEKSINLPRALSLPDLSLGKGAWPKEYEASSSAHGRHLKGFAYDRLAATDKYANFSVKIRDPSRYNFIALMDLSLKPDNPRPSKKVRS